MTEKSTDSDDEQTQNPAYNEELPKTELEAGTVAYDAAQHKPVVIVDPDAGSIDDQKPASRDRIVKAPGNRAFGFTPETQCVDIQFLSLSSTNTDSYTYPVTRLAVPDVKVGSNRLSIREYIQYQLIRDVMYEAVLAGTEEADHARTMFENAGVSTQLIEMVLDEAGLSDEN